MAKKKGQLVVFARFCGIPSLSGGQMTGLLDRLFVLPEHRSGSRVAALIEVFQVETKA